MSWFSVGWKCQFWLSTTSHSVDVSSCMQHTVFQWPPLFSNEPFHLVNLCPCTCFDPSNGNIAIRQCIIRFFSFSAVQVSISPVHCTGTCFHLSPLVLHESPYNKLPLVLLQNQMNCPTTSWANNTPTLVFSQRKCHTWRDSYSAH